MVILIKRLFDHIWASNQSEDEKKSSKAISTISTPVFLNSEVPVSLPLAPSAVATSSATSNKDFIIEEPVTTDVPNGGVSLSIKMNRITQTGLISHSGWFLTLNYY